MGCQEITETVTLQARTIHRIENGLGVKVACLTGDAWITQANDQRDIVVRPGEAVILDRPGLALVMALSDAQITTGCPALEEQLAA